MDRMPLLSKGIRSIFLFVPDLSGNWRRTQDRSGNTGRVIQVSGRVLSEHGEALMAVFDPLDDPAVRCG